MKMALTTKSLRMVIPAVLAIAVCSAAHAANRNPVTPGAASDHEVVDMWKAIEDGDIEVSLIPKDATEANVIFKNKTDKPLAIKLPEAFGGAPVLAQFGGVGGVGGGLGGGGLGGGGLGGGNQGFGGGFGGGGLGGGGLGGGGLGGGGFGGGFMNVAADKVRKVKVPTVCLEHGKEDPKPRVKYEITPIEKITKSKEAVEVVKMLARGEIPQNSAQAATWNLTDNLTWNELAYKDRVKHLNGSVEKFFAPQEIYFAMKIRQEAGRRAAAQPDTSKPSIGDLPETQSPKIQAIEQKQ